MTQYTTASNHRDAAAAKSKGYAWRRALRQQSSQAALCSAHVDVYAHGVTARYFAKCCNCSSCSGVFWYWIAPLTAENFFAHGRYCSQLVTHRRTRSLRDRCCCYWVACAVNIFRAEWTHCINIKGQIVERQTKGMHTHAM